MKNKNGQTKQIAIDSNDAVTNMHIHAEPPSKPMMNHFFINSKSIQNGLTMTYHVPSGPHPDIALISPGFGVGLTELRTLAEVNGGVRSDPPDACFPMWLG